MRVMRAVAVSAAVFGVWLSAAPAAGQTVVACYFVAGVGQYRPPASPEAAVHGAVGAEGRVANGRLGVGAEIGYFAPPRDLSGGFGVLSPNATLYLKNASPLVPFATAGYSLLFRFGTRTFNAFNVGAGFEYRTRPRVGLRVEVRDHIQSGSLGARNHYWAARAGLSFW